MPSDEITEATRILSGITSGDASATERLFQLLYNDLRKEAGDRLRLKGVLIAQEKGVTAGYALDNLQERGVLFCGPQVPVYGGMIIGESSREKTLVVNPCKTKALTNMRAAGSDDNILLTPPRILSLEQALEFIEVDELVEVTPKMLRLRKKILDHTDRKRAEKNA